MKVSHVVENLERGGLERMVIDLALAQRRAGHQVRVLASDDDSVLRLWIVDLGDARLIISGAAPDEEFAAATEAFIKAKPISGK